MTNGHLDPTLDSYLNITWSFWQGLIRFWGAEAAAARLMCALTTFRASPDTVDPSNEVLEHLARIPYSSYDALVYVTDLSHLVYATTLLDTFLSQTTQFLFLLIPSSMGTNQQVPLRTVIEAPSKGAALTAASTARTRDIGYLPFVGRVNFLIETYGLDVAISEDDLAALSHYPSIRNNAIHDQGIFELSVDESGNVTSTQKTCGLHPTRVTGEDVTKAIHAYERIARDIAKAVLTQVLKQESHPAVQSFLKAKAPGSKQPDPNNAMDLRNE